MTLSVKMTLIKPIDEPHRKYRDNTGSEFFLTRSNMAAHLEQNKKNPAPLRDKLLI